MNSNRPICGFTERVRDARSRMDLTQAQFAERMAVTPLTVHRWETGQSRPRALALERLQALEEATSNREAVDQSGAAHGLPISHVPLDFAGDPAAVLLIAEAYRLAHGHQFNAAFASETARIDPLPHQRIAVYERMLPQEPLRFLLADDAGAGKTIMTGLYVREMLFRRRIRRVLIVRRRGSWAIGSGSFAPCSGCNAASSPEPIAEMAQIPSSERTATGLSYPWTPW